MPTWFPDDDEFTGAPTATRVAVDPERESAALELDKLAGSGRPRRPYKASAGSMQRARTEMEEMRRTGEWGAAQGKHFVALYAWLHEVVYGVECEAGDGREFAAAASSAGGLLRAEFNNDPATMAEFVRWAWAREREREQWRRENGQQGSRISWRLMFSRKLLADWRVSLARKNGAG